MTEDDVLFGYRLQLFDSPRPHGRACRGVPYVRGPPLDLLRLEAAGRAARAGDAAPARAAAAADAEPALADHRGADRRLRARAIPALGPSGSPPSCAREVGRHRRLAQRRLALPARHGLNTRAKRLSLVAGYAAPYEPPREPSPERHIEAERPGELVGIDCFFVGRLQGTKGAVWQLTAIDVASSFAWAELVTCPQGNPTGAQTSKLARRVSAELKPPAGGSSGCSRTTAASSAAHFRQTLDRARRPPHPDPRRPAADQRPRRGAAQTILEECWRPAFARYLHLRFTGLTARPRPSTSTTTTSTASTTAASPAAGSPPTSSTVPAR